MSILLVIVAAYAVCSIVPPLLVELIATVIAVRLVGADRRARRSLPDVSRAAASRRSDRKPSRLERQALRRGLDAALDLTVFSSLLPHVVARKHLRRDNGQ